MILIISIHIMIVITLIIILYFFIMLFIILFIFIIIIIIIIIITFMLQRCMFTRCFKLGTTSGCSDEAHTSELRRGAGALFASSRGFKNDLSVKKASVVLGYKRMLLESDLSEGNVFFNIQKKPFFHGVLSKAPR